MLDNVFVFNNEGVKIDDLTGLVTVQRTEKQSYTIEAARSSFTIASTNSKATSRTLKTGNIVLVKNSESTVKNLCGVVWPSDPNGYEWSGGEYRIPLRSYEWILDRRYTDAQDKFTGSPGQQFAFLLSCARRQGYLPISTDTTYIQMMGEKVAREYNAAPIYQTINKLASDNSFYWWLSAAEDATTGLLELTPYWRVKRSKKFAVQLSCGGEKPNLTPRKVYESGEIANHIIVYGAGSDWIQRNNNRFERKDYASIGYYKQVFTKVIDASEETTRAGLRAIALDELNKSAFTLLRIEGTINAPPYPQTGDICSVVLPAGIGYMAERRGTVIDMQVEQVVITPTDGSYTVKLQETYDTDQSV